MDVKTATVYEAVHTLQEVRRYQSVIYKEDNVRVDVVGLTHAH